MVKQTKKAAVKKPATKKPAKSTRLVLKKSSPASEEKSELKLEAAPKQAAEKTSAPKASSKTFFGRLQKAERAPYLALFAVLILIVSYSMVFFIKNTIASGNDGFGSIILSGVASGQNGVVAHGSWSPQGKKCKNYSIYIMDNSVLSKIISPAPCYMDGDKADLGGEWVADLNLTPGSHQICAVLKHSKAVGNDQSLPACLNYEYNAANGIIKGHVYEDQDQDNTTQDYLALSGWVITLKKDGQVSSAVTTDGSGYYSFAGLSAGTYSVEVSSPSQWWVQMSAPTSITISGSQTFDNADFVNKLNPGCGNGRTELSDECDGNYRDCIHPETGLPGTQSCTPECTWGRCIAG